jgi:hypothetical protein
VQAYSAYIIRPDGHITQRMDLLCVDEVDAHRRASELAKSDTLELWQQERWIATFVPYPCADALRPSQLAPSFIFRRD